ncbi:hypothetical protein A2U01_0026434, partial [Trifolium medium]|nr:hypothetical protein [Trifolium medium]
GFAAWSVALADNKLVIGLIRYPDVYKQ